MNNPRLHKFLPYVLKPLSWLYGGVTGFRNWMFDHNWLKASEYDVPVVNIGNITVGGTGKTPHVEYVAKMLSDSYRIVILSRGYKRKTSGFVLANATSTPESIGDEPLQMYRKLGPAVRVAVCENRRKGISEIMKQFPDTQLILLDDAFQHRYVLPKVNVLLMDYNRPIYEDYMLPMGRLRESFNQIERADMIVVTKCPDSLSPLDMRLVTKKLDIRPFQKLFFSKVEYSDIRPVFPDDRPYHVDISSLSARDTVMLITGIANPRGFIRHFRHYPFKRVICHFPDHHDFSRSDITSLEQRFNALKGERKIILTTEKDAVRLAYNPYFPTSLKPFVFYIPVSVKMIPTQDNADFISELIKSVGA